MSTQSPVQLAQLAFFGGVNYLKQNPLFLWSAARNAAGLGITIPMDLLRWAIGQRQLRQPVESVALTSDPPAIGLKIGVNLFGNHIDVTSDLLVEAVESGADTLRVVARVQNLKLLAPPNSPATMMFKAMDLSKPAALLAMMPKRPAVLVEAEGDRFVFDLMKVKNIAESKPLRRALAAIEGVLSIRDVRTDGDLLVIRLAANPFGVPAALKRLRAPAV